MMNLLNLFKDFYIFMPYRHSGGHEKIWKDMLPLLVCLETLDFFSSKYFSAFFNIMKQIRPYQLTSWTEEHLIALAQVFNKGHNVNFAFFQAFNNLMKNMELGKFTK